MLKQKFSFRLRFPYKLLKNERREKKKKKKLLLQSKQGCKLKQKWGVDKTRNTEHSGTCRNIREHEKIKIIFMKKEKLIK